MNRLYLTILIFLQLLSHVAIADIALLCETIDDLLDTEKFSKELVLKYKKYPVDSLSDNKISQAYHEVSLVLSWYVKDKALYSKSLDHLKNFADSDYLQYKSREGFIGQCEPCEGTGVGKISCSSCKGNGKCTNYLCNEGKIKVKNKDFGEILVDCSVCLGEDNCKKCSGEGTVPGSCTVCMKRGVSFSMAKVKSILNSKLIVLKVLIKEKADADFVSSQLAKGLTKVGDEWMTAAQLKDLESKKERQISNGSKENFESPEFILKNLKRLYSNDKEGTLTKIRELRILFPDSEINLSIDNQLTYIQLLEECEILEQNGKIGLLVKTLERALLIEDSDELRERIKHFDEQTLGL